MKGTVKRHDYSKSRILHDKAPGSDATNGFSV